MFVKLDHFPSRGEHTKYLKPPPRFSNTPDICASLWHLIQWSPSACVCLKHTSAWNTMAISHLHLEMLPSLKLTARTWKLMVGILVSLWDDLFSGAFAVRFREGKLFLDDATNMTPHFVAEVSLAVTWVVSYIKGIKNQGCQQLDQLAAILAICSYPGGPLGDTLSQNIFPNNYQQLPGNIIQQPKA